jgi:hypothetical protein
MCGGLNHISTICLQPTGNQHHHHKQNCLGLGVGVIFVQP